MFKRNVINGLTNETVEIVCDGKKRLYPKSLVDKLPWFKTTNVFPLSKKELNEFFHWMAVGGKCDSKVWALMFKCSPVDESLMINIPEEFRIPGTGIVFDGDKLRYSTMYDYFAVAKVTEYFTMVYSRDWFAEYKFNDPDLNLVFSYFLGESPKFSHFTDVHRELAERYGFMNNCRLCDGREFCGCRFWKCLCCRDPTYCNCVCKRCNVKLDVHKQDLCDGCTKKFKCSVEDCEKPMFDKTSKWCEDHLCGFYGCRKSAEINKLCTYHYIGSCKYPGCDSVKDPKLIIGDPNQVRCPEHKNMTQ